MIELFTTIANKVGISASLLLSVCTHESGLRDINNFTDKNGGSHGICEINGKTARSIMKHVDILALQQREVNILVAALYLKKLQDKYLFDELVVSSYNMGSPKFKNGQLINKSYVEHVLAIRENYSD